MNFVSNKIKLENMWDKLEEKKLNPMSEADGNRWGFDYIQDVLCKLKQLEAKSLEEKDPFLYNQVIVSMLRAKEVESELREKLSTKNCTV